MTLRTTEPDDADFVQRGLANPEIRYPMGSPVKSRAETESWLADTDGDNFVVCLDDPSSGPAAEPGRRIGAVSVDDADWRRPELAYWLVPEAHGEGYGTAAVSLLVDYVFRTYDHPAVGAGAYAFNDASRGLLESLGFEQEGVIRRDRFVDGAYVDTVEYGLLRGDWWDDHADDRRRIAE